MLNASATGTEPDAMRARSESPRTKGIHSSAAPHLCSLQQARARCVDPAAQQRDSALGGEHLDDHLAPQRLVARKEDAGHATSTELALEAVALAEGVLQLRAEGVVHAKIQARAALAMRGSSASTESSRDARTSGVTAHSHIHFH